MCDCYIAKCEVCKKKIPVHIEDYCTPRENVKVYCSKHIPQTACTVERIIFDKRLPAELRGLSKVGFRIIDKEKYNYKAELSPDFKYSGCFLKFCPEANDHESLQENREERLKQYYNPSLWATLNTAFETQIEKVQFLKFYIE